MKTRKSLFLSVVTVFLLGVILGYLLPHTIRPTSLDENKKSEGYSQLAPGCDSGRCPEYQSLDVDGDGLSESVAVVPIGMTKGAGKVWVIKRGRVIFISQEYAGIGVKRLETNNGFILVHRELLPLGELGPEIEKKYFFKDGTFVPEKI